VGFYDPDLCPDPEAFIRQALGNLAWFRIDGEGDEPEPPKPGRKRKVNQVEPEPAADSSDDVGTSDDLGDMPEPPAGHPAWEQPPIEDWGAWVPGDYAMMLMAEGIAITGIPSRVGETGTADEPGEPDSSEPMESEGDPLACNAPVFFAEHDTLAEQGCPICGTRHRYRDMGRQHGDGAAPQGRVLRWVGPAPPTSETAWPMGP